MRQRKRLSQLARTIATLNQRVSSLTEELDEAHQTRAKLEKNLRQQMLEELRSEGWKSPRKSKLKKSGETTAADNAAAFSIASEGIC